jgi:hypothetical protein
MYNTDNVYPIQGEENDSMDHSINWCDRTRAIGENEMKQIDGET